MPRAKLTPTGHRSKFESKLASTMPADITYESLKIKYIVPESNHTYTPDFHIPNTNIHIEAKGKFTAAERKKMLLVKEQHPELRFVMVFQRSQNTLSKVSKTTYKMWAEKNGFEVVEPNQLLEFIKKERKKHV